MAATPVPSQGALSRHSIAVQPAARAGYERFYAKTTTLDRLANAQTVNYQQRKPGGDNFVKTETLAGFGKRVATIPTGEIKRTKRTKKIYKKAKRSRDRQGKLSVEILVERQPRADCPPLPKQANTAIGTWTFGSGEGSHLRSHRCKSSFQKSSTSSSTSNGLARLKGVYYNPNLALAITGLPPDTSVDDPMVLAIASQPQEDSKTTRASLTREKNDRQTSPCVKMPLPSPNPMEHGARHGIRLALPGNDSNTRSSPHPGELITLQNHLPLSLLHSPRVRLMHWLFKLTCTIQPNLVHLCRSRVIQHFSKALNTLLKSALPHQLPRTLVLRRKHIVLGMIPNLGPLGTAQTQLQH